MQPVTKQTLKIWWDHTKTYKYANAYIVFGIVVNVAGTVAVPYLAKILVTLFQAGDFEQMRVVVWYILGVSLVTSIVWRIVGYVFNYLQPRIMSDLLNTCYEYLLGHSYSFFSNNFGGSLVTKVNRYQRSYEKFTDTITWDLSKTILLTVFVLVTISYTQPIIGGMFFVWMILMVTVVYAVAKYKLKFDIESSKQETRSTGHLADTITNSINLMLFTSQKSEMRLFGKITDKLYQLRRFSWNVDNHLNAFVATAMILLEFAMLTIMVNLASQGRFSIGDFVLVQSYMFQVFGQLWSLNRKMRDVFSSFADANEMTVMLLEPHEVVDANNANNLKVRAGAIKFHNVGFHYHEETPILENFNLSIAPGERVALVGPSGGGKSTIIKLLFRFKDIQAGQILVDGQDISQVTQDSLRKAISLVPQEPILFHRSLLDNIRYGRPSATEAEVVAAAKAAHAHEFISKFPDGYKTFVGERGVKLSGGERQRVAIARAILKNAPLLVLDEATSSLDSESELFIQDALNTLMKDKTTIVVAHRLSTIMKMDRIIVIEDGQIIEQGKHAELLKAKQGTYQKLWEIQAGSFVTTKAT